MNPFFSVIIPLYNKEKYIQNTLQSVLDQFFSDYEIIVVNDGSTDGSTTVVREFNDPRIRYYEKENGGASSARNEGISLAEGKYIAFLDADDYWYPYFLEEIHKYILRFPEQKVFSTATELEYKNKISKAKYALKKTGDYEIVDYFDTTSHKGILFTPASSFNILFTSASVFQRTVFSEIGVFDKTIKSGQDVDLWIRVGLRYKVCFIWRTCVRYVYDPRSLSKNISNISDKPNYSKYIDIESKNKALKKYIDSERFSLAIKSKLLADRQSFNYFFEHIDLKSLSYKKRILLFIPEKIIRALAYLKSCLIKGLMSFSAKNSKT